MIKNIIFDFGGVILTDDDIGFLFDNKELLDILKVDRSVLGPVWDKNWKDVGENRLTIFEYYDVLQKELVGRSDHEFSKRLFEIYKERTKTLPLYSLLPKLSSKYDLFALTNIFKEGLVFKRDKFKLDNYFKFIAASCDIGISKPNQEIFDYLIDKTNIDPKETIFVDDREKNVIKAQELGFVAIRYVNYNGILKFFRELGIIDG